MKQTYVLSLIVMSMLIAACQSEKTPSSQKKEQDRVTHVFDQDLQQKAEQAKAEQGENQAPMDQDTVKAVDQSSIKDGSPLYVIQQYTKELQDLDQTTKDASNRDQIIATKVRKFFDFDALAQKSLGTHWYQINYSQRQEYSDLFISLIERSYLSRSKDLVGQYELRFEDEKVTPKKATVKCVVEKDDVDIDIVYELHRSKGKWMIYNVVFDQVDLVKNYQSQFGRIIAKSKFSGLVNTMRDKLDDDVQVNI